MHALKELANDSDKICEAAKLAHDFPQSVSTDCVECLREIHMVEEAVEQHAG